MTPREFGIAVAIVLLLGYIAVVSRNTVPRGTDRIRHEQPLWTPPPRGN